MKMQVVIYSSVNIYMYTKSRDVLSRPIIPPFQIKVILKLYCKVNKLFEFKYECLFIFYIIGQVIVIFLIIFFSKVVSPRLLFFHFFFFVVVLPCSI